MTETYVDASAFVAIEEMPLCPLCDQPLFRGEGFVIGYHQQGSHLACGLIHRTCYEIALEEADDEDDDDQ